MLHCYSEYVKPLEQTLVEQLIGRGPRTDVELVAGLGVDYDLFKEAMDRLLDRGEVREVGADPETLYALTTSEGDTPLTTSEPAKVKESG